MINTNHSHGTFYDLAFGLSTSIIIFIAFSCTRHFKFISVVLLHTLLVSALTISLHTAYPFKFPTVKVFIPITFFCSHFITFNCFVKWNSINFCRN